MTLIRYTLWPGLYDIDHPTPVRESWTDITTRFSTHARVARKDQASGFGPYHLAPPQAACYRHSDGLPRDAPHRCDSSVADITLLVFDADQGTKDTYHDCDRKLAQAGVARLWYSTYNHRPDAPAYRLLVPLTRSVAPAAYGPLRLAVRRAFSVPCDVRACSGLSHFYYAPSCPPRSEPTVIHGLGEPLDPDDYMASSSVHIAPAPKPVDMSGWAPPSGDYDLDELRGHYRLLVSKWARSVSRREKSRLLDLCLRGLPLAEHGHRNEFTLIVAGILAWSAPHGTPLAALVALLSPSVEAMISAGSKLTREKAERMLRTAMRNRAAHDARAESMRQVVVERRDTLRSTLGGNT